jgi:hypothetical protein
VEVVTYDSALSRPDLPVPLSPLRGISLLVRRRLLCMGGPNFARTYHATSVLAIAACVVGALSLMVRPPWQKAVLDASVLIGLYVIIRALATLTFERGQRSFEPAWISAQSEVLRQHAFEVLRFTVQDLSDEHQRARVSYDLSRPDDLRKVLRRQDRERSSTHPSRATVEFAYQTQDGVLAVAQVHRRLPDLTLLTSSAGPGSPWVRFPQAYYVGRLEGGRHPARRTYWALSGPVQLTARESAYGGVAGLASAPGASVSSSGSGSFR